MKAAALGFASHHFWGVSRIRFEHGPPEKFCVPHELPDAQVAIDGYKGGEAVRRCSDLVTGDAAFRHNGDLPGRNGIDELRLRFEKSRHVRSCQ